jgi:hypothetical protein
MLSFLHILYNSFGVASSQFIFFCHQKTTEKEEVAMLRAEIGTPLPVFEQPKSMRVLNIEALRSTAFPFSSVWLCFNIDTFPQHVFLFPLHGTHLLLTSDLTNYCRLFVLQLELSWATVHSNSHLQSQD